jgi:hypothetical protein
MKNKMVCEWIDIHKMTDSTPYINTVFPKTMQLTKEESICFGSQKFRKINPDVHGPWNGSQSRETACALSVSRKMAKNNNVSLVKQPTIW